MQQVMAVIILILTLTGTLASGLQANGSCPMLAAHGMPHSVAASDVHAHHGSAHGQSGLAADLCVQACLSTILPQLAAATPLTSRVDFLAGPAEPVLPNSLQPALAERPPKTLA